jgi:hypothetical protein
VMARYISQASMNRAGATERIDRGVRRLRISSQPISSTPARISTATATSLPNVAAASAAMACEM